MTAAEIAATLERVDTELTTATEAGDWPRAAALTAQRGELQRQHKAALETERAAMADLAARQRAGQMAAIRAAGEGLQGRWGAWLAQLDSLDAQARALWLDFRQLKSEESQLGREAQRLGVNLPLSLAVESEAARATKRGVGLLVWNPKF